MKGFFVLKLLLLVFIQDYVFGQAFDDYSFIEELGSGSNPTSRIESVSNPTAGSESGSGFNPTSGSDPESGSGFIPTSGHCLKGQKGEPGFCDFESEIIYGPKGEKGAKGSKGSLEVFLQNQNLPFDNEILSPAQIDAIVNITKLKAVEFF